MSGPAAVPGGPGRRAIPGLAAVLSPGCYTTQLGLLRTGLDSLRTQVDTLTVRDSVAYRVLAETRRELAQQRDLLLSTRASSGSTMQELFDQMSRLEGKLDEVGTRFTKLSERSVPAALPSTVSVSGAPPGAVVAPPVAVADPTQLFDLSTRDLTEGRYALALTGYRDFLRRFPGSELADNAQYGVGECFFAQAAFDSAAAEYAKVGTQWPKGDRAAAALYKLGLSQDRLGRTAEARKTLEELIRRFPSSSEAGLARDRIGTGRR